MTLAEPAVPPAPRWMSQPRAGTGPSLSAEPSSPSLLAGAVLPHAVEPFEPLSVSLSPRSSWSASRSRCTSSSGSRPTAGRWPSWRSRSAWSRWAASGRRSPGSSPWRCSSSCRAPTRRPRWSSTSRCRPARRRRGRGPAGAARRAHHRALGWLSLILAVLVADLAGALAFTVAIIGTSGYPGPQLWREQLVPIAVVSPVVVSVGIMVLLLSTFSSWAWVLVVPVLSVVGLMFRRFGKVARKGNSVERVYEFARRVEQVSPDEAGTQQIVQAVRELLNAERVALWLPPYLDEEPRLIVSAENGAVWYDGPGRLRRRLPPPGGLRRGPLLVSLARADEEEVVRPRTARGLRPARGAGHDRGGRARLPRGLRPPQRDRLLRRQRPRRAGVDAHPCQRGDPAPAAAHPDPLRRRPRPAHRAAQPPAAVRGDRPAPRGGPGGRAGRADPRRPRQLHRGHRHPRARGQRRTPARHGRPAPRARASAGAAGAHGGRAVRRPAAGPVPRRHRARRPPPARGRVDARPGRRTGSRGDSDDRRRRRAGARHGRRHAHATRRRRPARRRGLRGSRELPPRPRPAEPAPPATGHRARAGHGRRADQRGLPADHRRPDLRHRLRGDAGALGPSALRRRSRPTTSSTWPSRSAGSARSPTTSWTSPWPAAVAGWTRTSRSRSR